MTLVTSFLQMKPKMAFGWRSVPKSTRRTAISTKPSCGRHIEPSFAGELGDRSSGELVAATGWARAEVKRAQSPLQASLKRFDGPLAEPAICLQRAGIG